MNMLIVRYDPQSCNFIASLEMPSSKAVVDGSVESSADAVDCILGW